MSIFECDLPPLSSPDVPHILVVDDDERLRELLRTYLSKQDWMVSVAQDAADARIMLEHFHCDVMILDVMMPGETGVHFARTLRDQSASHPPILMLTAMSEADDRIAGLEAGVDDYLTKPFEPRELVLRIQAILRRTRQQKKAAQSLTFGNFCLNLDSHLLTQNDQPVHLTEAEMNILIMLAKHAGSVISREQIMHNDTNINGERSVDVQITRLRRRIEEDPSHPRFIQTVRGAGYVLKV